MVQAGILILKSLQKALLLQEVARLRVEDGYRSLEDNDDVYLVHEYLNDLPLVLLVRCILLKPEDYMLLLASQVVHEVAVVVVVQDKELVLVQTDQRVRLVHNIDRLHLLHDASFFLRQDHVTLLGSNVEKVVVPENLSW